MPTDHSPTTALALRDDTLDLLTTRLDDTLRGCEALVQSGLLPKHIGKPQAALAILLRGRELGMAPMHALSSMYLVEGKVTLSSATQQALAERAGIQVDWLRHDEKIAEVQLTRPGRKPYTGRWTIEMAQRAGLSGKDVWKKYPEAMLRARAITDSIRAYCPDVLGGPIYDAEELGDLQAGASDDAPPQAAAKGAPQVVDAEIVPPPEKLTGAKVAEELGIPLDGETGLIAFYETSGKQFSRLTPVGLGKLRDALKNGTGDQYRAWVATKTATATATEQGREPGDEGNDDPFGGGDSNAGAEG